MNVSTKYIIDKIENNPEIALVLGSGLSDLSSCMIDAVRIKYSDIPGFTQTTVKGHSGEMMFGRIHEKECVILSGRFHYYEGYTAKQITHYIQVLNELGVKKLLLTNAAGGISDTLAPGDLMIIEDHINFAGVNPMIGSNDDNIGPRFFDMSEAYDKRMRESIYNAAKNLNIDIKSGIYIMYSGPSFETPAEIRMFGRLGADAVGMSTVPEVIAANHCGIKVAAISCITNYAAGIGKNKLSHEEVMETGKRVEEEFKALILKTIEML